jgi:hypothetical protein
MARAKRRGAAEYLVSRLLSPEAARQGNYGVERIVTPGGEVGRAVRNRGASTLDRWRAAGQLTAAQDGAISIFERSHRLVYGSGSALTARYDPTASIRSTGSGGEERRAGERMRAKALLDRIDQVVFAVLPASDAAVFREVVIEERPAIEAGRDLGGSDREVQIACRRTVQLVAGMIARALQR